MDACCYWQQLYQTPGSSWGQIPHSEVKHESIVRDGDAVMLFEMHRCRRGAGEFVI